ncbi:MAG: DUF1553 domain-containing protein, partial [Opitutaceae bacterium]|nr:DUF1553 domain-containing protein [Opitutaceae bacterium]
TIAAFLVARSLIAINGASEVDQAIGLSFERDIAPILEAKCLGCHNPNKQEGDFSMATLEAIQTADEEYVIPGNAADSMLHWITLPLDDGESPEMPEEGGRRMIYAHKIRMVSVDIFGAFDCPDAGQMKPNRPRSITPVQSLGLLNSPFVNSHAAFFAERLQREVGDDRGAQIERAFAIAFSREASPPEREIEF